MVTPYRCTVGRNIAFLREEGGTRQGFPEANEMSFGGSLRSVTEGAFGCMPPKMGMGFARSICNTNAKLAIKENDKNLQVCNGTQTDRINT